MSTPDENCKFFWMKKLHNFLGPRGASRLYLYPRTFEYYFSCPEIRTRIWDYFDWRMGNQRLGQLLRFQLRIDACCNMAAR